MNYYQLLKDMQPLLRTTKAQAVRHVGDAVLAAYRHSIDDWSPSGPGRFTSGETALWVDPQK